MALASAVAVGAVVGLVGAVVYPAHPAPTTYYVAAPAAVATRPVAMSTQAQLPRAPVALRAQTPASIEEMEPVMYESATSSTAAPFALNAGVGVIGVAAAAAAAVGAGVAKLLAPSSNAEAQAPSVGRREFGVGMATLLPAYGAFAEILPDDDDPELLAAARANRKSKLAQEKALEAVTDGPQAGRLDAQCVPVQKTVIALGLIGQQLGKGFIDKNSMQASTNVSISELAASIQELSGSSDEAKSMGVTFLKDFQSLQKSINAGDVKNARPTYVSTVANLESWAAAAGVVGSIQGL